MQGHVSAYDTASGRKWRAIIDLGRQPCRRCLECCARTFDVNATGCPRRKCRGDLAASVLERRQLSSKGHATKRAAQAAARELIGDVEHRGYTAPRTTDLAGYLRDWLGGLALKPTTIADYTQSAEVYVIPRVGHVSLQQVTPELLDRLYRDLERAGSKRGTPLSPKSVRNVHIMLHKALGDATARGHIGRNPASLANPPSAKAARSKAAQQCWTREQIRVFLESVADHRLYGLWRLLAATGLRRAEVLGLRWSDLDGTTLVVAERTVTTAAGKVVWQDDGKSAKAARRIALDATTLQALRVHRQRQLEEHLAVGPAWSSDPRDEGLMFTLQDGRAIRPDSCWRMFTRLAKAAGLSHKGGLHVLLRHSYATAALRAGVSPEVVSARVGHAHVATTLSIYAHVTEADDQDAADATAAYLDG